MDTTHLIGGLTERCEDWWRMGGGGSEGKERSEAREESTLS